MTKNSFVFNEVNKILDDANISQAIIDFWKEQDLTCSFIMKKFGLSWTRANKVWNILFMFEDYKRHS